MENIKRRKVLSVDIAVVGGGMSGVCAALRAAKEGYEVAIIERNDALGGTSTLGLQGQLNGCFLRGQRVLTSLGWEIIQGMMSKGYAKIKYNVQMSPNPEIKVDKAYVNSQKLGEYLEELVKEEKIKVLYNNIINEIYITKEGTVVLECEDNEATTEVRSKRVVDASGFAGVFDKLGLKTYKTLEGERQVSTLMFNIGGINMEEFEKVTGEEIGNIGKKGFEKGRIPSTVFQLYPIPGSDEIGVNATRCVVENYIEEDVVKGYKEAKSQIPGILEYIKEAVPGCKDAYVSKVASILGIRLHKAMEGKYMLNKEDVSRGAYFKDGVSMCCYPSDMQYSTEATSYSQIGGSGYYEIPYSSMVTDECPYVIACGKSICSDEYAYGSLRVVPSVMATGEVAGVAAAISLDRDLPLTRIDVTVIREKSMESKLLLRR